MSSQRIGGSAPYEGFYFNGTEHSSNATGSSVSFNFNGSAVWYFADDFPKNSKVSISLDGAPGEVVDTATTGSAWVTTLYFPNEAPSYIVEYYRSHRSSSGVRQA
jgi:hypothetical protein